VRQGSVNIDEEALLYGNHDSLDEDGDDCSHMGSVPLASQKNEVKEQKKEDKVHAVIIPEQGTLSDQAKALSQTEAHPASTALKILPEGAPADTLRVQEASSQVAPAAVSSMASPEREVPKALSPQALQVEVPQVERVQQSPVQDAPSAKPEGYGVLEVVTEATGQEVPPLKNTQPAQKSEEVTRLINSWQTQAVEKRIAEETVAKLQPTVDTQQASKSQEEVAAKESAAKESAGTPKSASSEVRPEAQERGPEVQGPGPPANVQLESAGEALQAKASQPPAVAQADAVQAAPSSERALPPQVAQAAAVQRAAFSKAVQPPAHTIGPAASASEAAQTLTNAPAPQASPPQAGEAREHQSEVPQSNEAIIWEIQQLNGKWIECEPELAQRIQGARAVGMTRFPCGNAPGGQMYQIDLQTMRQIHPETGRSKQIRCRSTTTSQPAETTSRPPETTSRPVELQTAQVLGRSTLSRPPEPQASQGVAMGDAWKSQGPDAWKSQGHSEASAVDNV